MTLRKMLETIDLACALDIDINETINMTDVAKIAKEYGKTA